MSETKEKSEVQTICEAYEIGYRAGQTFDDGENPFTDKAAEAWELGYQTGAGLEIDRFGVLPYAKATP